MKKGNWIFIFALILVAGLSRLLPHPPNFTALGAMALFGGAALNSKILRIALPLAALFVTDVIINNTIYYNAAEGFTLFYSGAIWTYLAIGIIAVVASGIVSKLNISKVVLGSFTASALFFIISNFGVWSTGILYPTTVEGLVTCYAAALPFFGNTIAGDLFFSTVLFGGFYLADSKIPQLARVKG